MLVNNILLISHTYITHILQYFICGINETVDIQIRIFCLAIRADIRGFASGLQKKDDDDGGVDGSVDGGDGSEMMM